RRLQALRDPPELGVREARADERRHAELDQRLRSHERGQGARGVHEAEGCHVARSGCHAPGQAGFSELHGQMKMKKTRSIVPGAMAALGALLFGILAASLPAHAQPVPPDKAGGSGSGSGATGGLSDEQLYPCKNAKGMVAVTFKPETELKDLVTWAMGFTCK